MTSDGGDPSISGIPGTDLSYSNSGTNSATQAAPSSSSGDGLVIESVIRTPVVGGMHGSEIIPPSPVRGSESVATAGTHEHRSVSVGTRTMSVKTIAEAAV